MVEYSAKPNLFCIFMASWFLAKAKAPMLFSSANVFVDVAEAPPSDSAIALFGGGDIALTSREVQTKISIIECLSISQL
jgi:hypothetical protein